MGFELFLARIECEHLIQLMSQASHTECLEIIQKRRSATALQEEPELSDAPNGVLEEDGARRDVLVNPEQSLKPLDLEMNERQNPERGSFLSEDKSILEMQKDYPDLAFRQRPIFKSSSIRANHSRRDVKFSREATSPQSITSHSEAPEPAPEVCSSEDQQVRVGAVSLCPGPKQRDEASVTDLAEMMDKLKLKEFHGEEPLKCPVEETAQCERNETVPILCSPSHQSICSIAGCCSCSTSDLLPQHRDITEPPQSFYIPNHVSSSTPAPPAVHENNEHTSSRAGVEQILNHTPEI